MVPRRTIEEQRNDPLVVGELVEVPPMHRAKIGAFALVLDFPFLYVPFSFA